MKNKKFKDFRMQHFHANKKLMNTNRTLLKSPSLLLRFTTCFLKTFSISMLAFLASFQTVFAAPNIQPINDTLNTFGSTLQGFAVPVCGLVFIVSGLAMMTGQQGRSWAKPTMLFAAVGYLIVAFAPDIVDMIASSATPL